MLEEICHLANEELEMIGADLCPNDTRMGWRRVAMFLTLTPLLTPLPYRFRRKKHYSTMAGGSWGSGLYSMLGTAQTLAVTRHVHSSLKT
jgi:hypothetical protein